MLTTATEEETKDLEVAALHVTCDSTSDGSGSGEDDSCCGGDCEASEEDKKFMRRAQEVARNSPDPQTKVSLTFSLGIGGEGRVKGWEGEELKEKRGGKRDGGEAYRSRLRLHSCSSTHITGRCRHCGPSHWGNCCRRMEQNAGWLRRLL